MIRHISIFIVEGQDLTIEVGNKALQLVFSNALKSSKLEFTEVDEIIAIFLHPTMPYESRVQEIEIDIVAAPKNFVLLCEMKEINIPEDKIKNVSEYIVRVNATQDFVTLKINFDDMTVSLSANTMVGPHFNEEDVANDLMSLIYDAYSLYRNSYLPLRNILSNNLDAKTAFQQFKRTSHAYEKLLDMNNLQ